MKKLLFVILLITLSCKTETKGKGPVEKVVEVEAPARNLLIEVYFKTNKDDDFKLAVDNIIKDEFQKKSVVITEKVSPSSLMETISANFGEGIISNSIRFDLGTKELKEIEFESINFSYGPNSLAISGSDLYEYFIINKFVAYDSITSKIKTQRVDGVHYPAIALNGKAINILVKE